MNVGIYELEHFESVYPLIRLYDERSNVIFLFVSPLVYNALYPKLTDSSADIKWVVKSDNQRIRSFLFKIFFQSKKIKLDKIFLHTVSNNHIFFVFFILLWSDPKKIYITIHEVRDFLFPRLSFNPKKIIYYLGKRMLYFISHHFVTISESTHNFLKKTIRNNISTYWIPGGIFEEKFYHMPDNPSSCIRLVVPGSLDYNRRNYNDVFDFLLKAKEVNLPVEVYLLGGYLDKEGYSIIQKCQALSIDYPHLFFYDCEFISFDLFEEIMHKAHFIWAPSASYTMSINGVEEIYGISKVSGNIFDAIRYARPIIIPDTLNIDSFQHLSAFKYKNVNDIVSLLMDIVHEPNSYKIWVDKSLEVSGYYTIKNLRIRIFSENHHH
ncbi:MAG: hypothetical protein ACK55K_00695 [Bacteroidota bacterium]